MARSSSSSQSRKEEVENSSENLNVMNYLRIRRGKLLTIKTFLFEFYIEEAYTK
jgi:hypothetical protein